MTTINRVRSDSMPRGRYTIGGTSERLSSRIGWWDRKIFQASNSDIKIIISSKYALRPDLLAYDLYGSSSLSWLVLQFNTIIDINTEFVEGSIITVPTKTRLYTQLLTVK